MNLDLLEENIEVSMIKLAKYQHMVGRSCKKNVKIRNFILGNLVLRKITGNTRWKIN